MINRKLITIFLVGTLAYCSFVAYATTSQRIKCFIYQLRVESFEDLVDRILETSESFRIETGHRLPEAIPTSDGEIQVEQQLKTI